MKRRTVFGKLACLLLVAVCVLTMVVPALAVSEQEIIQDAKNGVYRVLITDEDLNPVATGTAFAVGESGVAPQYFITNRHVVECEYTLDFIFFEYSYTDAAYKVYLMKNSNAVTYNSNGVWHLESSLLIPCTIVYYKNEENPDIAVIRTDEPVEGAVALPLAESVSDADVAAPIYALGFPGLADITAGSRLVAGADNMTITTGVISRYGMMATHDNCKMIVHDAKISSGNSGGPLLNSKGEVVGINTMHATDGYTNDYYALSCDYIKSVCNELEVTYTVGSGPQWWVIALIVVVSVALAATAAVLVVRLVKKPRPQPTPNPVPTPPAPVDDMLRIQGEFGVFVNRRYKVDKSITIGCGSQNTLAMPEGTAGVSHKHCVVTPGNHRGEIQLTDIGSKYGTFLSNGQKLTPNVPVVLRKGDRFWLGSKDQTFRVTGKGGV